MPLSLLNHSALALFAQRTRIPTSARSIGFCAIWVCISSSSRRAHYHSSGLGSGDNNDQSVFFSVLISDLYQLILSCLPYKAVNLRTNFFFAQVWY